MLGDPYTGALVVAVAAAAAGLLVLPLTRSLPLLIFLIPFRLYVDFPSTKIEFSVTNFIVVGFGGACLAAALLRGRPRLLRWELSMVALLFWIVASFGWSSSAGASVGGVFRWIVFFSAILLGTECVLRAGDPAAAVRRILIGVLALVGVWSIVGFIQAAVGMDVMFAFLQTPISAAFYPPGLVDDRIAGQSFNWLSGTDVQPFGPFVNSIEFGVLTAAGLGIALALAVGRSRLAPRWLVLSVLVLATAANIACLKGTGWAAAGVAVAIAFVSLGRSIRRVLGVSLLTLVLLGLLVYIFQDALIERVQAIAVREGTQGAAAQALSRPAIWVYYLHALAVNPLMGLGVGTSILYGPIHWTATVDGNTSVATVLPTENSYLTAAIETGVVGLLLVLVVMVGALARGLRLARRYPDLPLAQGAGAAAIGLAAILTGNLTVDAFNEQILSLLMGVLIGVIVAANRRLPEPGTVGT
jgi:O-antigen ligase